MMELAEMKRIYETEFQPKEFYDSLGDDIKRCFDGYGVKTYVEMLELMNPRSLVSNVFSL